MDVTAVDRVILTHVRPHSSELLGVADISLQDRARRGTRLCKGDLMTNTDGAANSTPAPGPGEREDTGKSKSPSRNDAPIGPQRSTDPQGTGHEQTKGGVPEKQSSEKEQ